MLEKGSELLIRLPPRIEATVGMVGTSVYGVMAAVPAEVQNVFKEVPISGWLINILSAADLRMSAGALTIVFGAIAFDGFKRMLDESSIGPNNQE